MQGKMLVLLSSIMLCTYALADQSATYSCRVFADRYDQTSNLGALKCSPEMNITITPGKFLSFSKDPLKFSCDTVDIEIAFSTIEYPEQGKIGPFMRVTAIDGTSATIYSEAPYVDLPIILETQWVYHNQKPGALGDFGAECVRN